MEEVVAAPTTPEEIAAAALALEHADEINKMQAAVAAKAAQRKQVRSTK